MSLRTITLAVLLAPLFLAVTPVAEAHSGAVRVHLGLGAVIVEPPLFGRVEIGYPVPLRGPAVHRHYHGLRLCQLDHRRAVHRHDHWRYHRH